MQPSLHGMTIYNIPSKKKATEAAYWRDQPFWVGLDKFRI